MQQHIVHIILKEQIFRLKCFMIILLQRARESYRDSSRQTIYDILIFSRNPKIAEFLKAYNFVKEYGEGVDRIYKELKMLAYEIPDII